MHDAELALLASDLRHLINRGWPTRSPGFGEGWGE